jgi:hypothetical protein
VDVSPGSEKSSRQPAAYLQKVIAMSWTPMLLFTVLVIAVLILFALIWAAGKKLEEPGPGGQVL